MGSLLSVPPPEHEEPVTLPPDLQRRAVLDALVEWAWELARRGPVVIAFEDVQWADPTSIDLIRTLVTHAGDHAVLIVLTCRAPFELPWPPHAHEQRMLLGPLAPPEAQMLVHSMIGAGAMQADVLQTLLTRSDGVPLFLEEVMRMLVDSPMAVESLPVNLRELLSARLDRLSPGLSDTIRLAAVIGRFVSRELLLAVSPKPRSRWTGTSTRSSLRVSCRLTAIAMRSSTCCSATPRTTGCSGRRVQTFTDGSPRLIRTAFRTLAETQPELLAHHFTEAGAIGPAFREWSRAGAAQSGQRRVPRSRRITFSGRSPSRELRSRRRGAQRWRRRSFVFGRTSGSASLPRRGIPRRPSPTTTSGPSA